MAQLLFLVRDRILSFLKDERAQDVFEYVLIIGGVTVAVLLAIITPVGATMINAVVTGTGNALDCVVEIAGYTCPA